MYHLTNIMFWQLPVIKFASDMVMCTILKYALVGNHVQKNVNVCNCFLWILTQRKPIFPAEKPKISALKDSKTIFFNMVKLQWISGDVSFCHHTEA